MRLQLFRISVLFEIVFFIECVVASTTALDALLFDASTTGNITLITELLNEGSNINAKNINGTTPLMLSSMAGKMTSVQLLVDRGAIIDSRDEKNYTALIFAAQNGHSSIVNFLVNSGADITATTINAWMPVHFAAWENKADIVELLLIAGSDVEARNDRNLSAFDLARMSPQEGHAVDVMERFTCVGNYLCVTSPCRTYVCDMGNCVARNISEGTICNDEQDTCKDGVCVRSARNCVWNSSCKISGAYDPQKKMCVYTNKPDGTICDIDYECFDGICTFSKMYPRVSRDISGGAISGIVVGMLGVLLAAASIYYVMRERRKMKAHVEAAIANPRSLEERDENAIYVADIGDLVDPPMSVGVEYTASETNARQSARSNMPSPRIATEPALPESFTSPSRYHSHSHEAPQVGEAFSQLGQYPSALPFLSRSSSLTVIQCPDERDLPLERFRSASEIPHDILPPLTVLNSRNDEPPPLVPLEGDVNTGLSSKCRIYDEIIQQQKEIVCDVTLVSEAISTGLLSLKPLEFPLCAGTLTPASSCISSAATPSSAFPWEISSSSLEIIEKIGHGEFGDVHRGRGLCLRGKAGWRNVAIKSFKILLEDSDDSDTSSVSESFRAEAQLMASLNHPNLIVFLGMCITCDPWVIVLEYCEQGDLRSYLRKHASACFVRPGSKRSTGSRTAMTETDFLSFAYQVCSGCEHLSRKNIVHRDLAVRNVMLTRPSGNILVAKVADFGLSRTMRDGSYYLKNENSRLPLKWMALESITHQKFSKESDVWGFGVVMWEMWSCGSLPYGTRRNMDVIEDLINGDRLDQPVGCSDAVYTIMRSCWEENPYERPQFSTIVQTLETLLQLENKEFFDELQDLLTDLAYDDFRSLSADVIDDPGRGKSKKLKFDKWELRTRQQQQKYDSILMGHGDFNNP